jgi:hypothetical protein
MESGKRNIYFLHSDSQYNSHTHKGPMTSPSSPCLWREGLIKYKIEVIDYMIFIFHQAENLSLFRNLFPEQNTCLAYL